MYGYMIDPFDTTLRGTLRRRIYDLWQKQKRAEPLAGEERILAELMQQHEEFHNTWEFADVLDEHEYNTESGVNPFLHITFDAIIVNQINQDEPKGISSVYERLRNKDYDLLEAIHEIAAVFVTEFYEISRGRKPFSDERYLKQLGKL